MALCKSIHLCSISDIFWGNCPLPHTNPGPSCPPFAISTLWPPDNFKYSIHPAGRTITRLLLATKVHIMRTHVSILRPTVMHVSFGQYLDTTFIQTRAMSSCFSHNVRFVLCTAYFRWLCNTSWAQFARCCTEYGLETPRRQRQTLVVWLQWRSQRLSQWLVFGYGWGWLHAWESRVTLVIYVGVDWFAVLCGELIDGAINSEVLDNVTNIGCAARLILVSQLPNKCELIVSSTYFECLEEKLLWKQILTFGWYFGLLNNLNKVCGSWKSELLVHGCTVKPIKMSSVKQHFHFEQSNADYLTSFPLNTMHLALSAAYHLQIIDPRLLPCDPPVSHIAPHAFNGSCGLLILLPKHTVHIAAAHCSVAGSTPHSSLTVDDGKMTNHEASHITEKLGTVQAIKRGTKKSILERQKNLPLNIVCGA